MTNEAINIISTLFTQFWRLFTSWKVPGTEFTPAQFYLFVLLLPLIIKLVMSIISVSTDTFVNNSNNSKGSKNKNEK